MGEEKRINVISLRQTNSTNLLDFHLGHGPCGKIASSLTLLKILCNVVMWAL